MEIQESYKILTLQTFVVTFNKWGRKKTICSFDIPKRA